MFSQVSAELVEFDQPSSVKIHGFQVFQIKLLCITPSLRGVHHQAGALDQLDADFSHGRHAQRPCRRLLHLQGSGDLQPFFSIRLTNQPTHILSV